MIRGCIPKKLLVYAVELRRRLRGRRGLRLDRRRAGLRLARLIAAKDAEIARLEAVYHDGLRRAGVQLCGARATRRSTRTGCGSPTGPSTRAKHMLIATGARPFVPDIPGAELGITSNEMFGLEQQPKRMAVVGGGYVACEFAGIMNGLGTEVIQLYRGDQILRGFDDDLRDHLADAMRARGVVLEIQRDVRGSSAPTPASGSPSTTARRMTSTRCSSPPAATRTPQASGSRSSASASGRTARSRSTTGRRPRCRRSTRSAT